MSYNFNQFNDKEFEEFSLELISKFLNVKIERFKPGKDSGVDGRFFIDKEKEVVFQVKHYLNSGYNKLVSSLKKTELDKVNSLSPAKYYIITSLPLSRANKEEIKNIFKPYMQSSSDVFGQEDLNDLLSSNPKIEEKYFKLWISSTTVFNRILNNAIKGRSEFELEQIRKKTNLYVQTECHLQALGMLKKNNVIIISGEPGIGKTTLAENLCLYFTSKEYEFYAIEESLSEAENVFKNKHKQLFYFDDFLGSNYFEAIENKKDSHIIKFIDRIKNDKNKIFILTSRTNILTSGMLYSDIFFSQKINKNEYLLSIGNFKELDKAKILYNHIWFSKLDEVFLNEIYKDKRYREIIRHENFNPRIIEFITDSERVATRLENYWDYIWSSLENPSYIWNNCFKVQSNEYVRSLVLLTVFNGGKIKEIELHDSYNCLIHYEDIKNPSHTEKDFSFTSQLATKSFLNRSKTYEGLFYTLFNPSITDFILNEYCENKSKLLNVFLALCTIKSLENLQSLKSEKIISSSICDSIYNNLLDDIDLDEKSSDYILLLINNFKGIKSRQKIILKYLNVFVDDFVPIINIELLLNLLYYYKNECSSISKEYLQWLLKNYSISKETLQIILEFIIYLKIEDAHFLYDLKTEMENYFDYTLDQIPAEIDVTDYLNNISDEYGNVDTMYDEDGLYDKIYEKLEEEYYGFNEVALEQVGINVEYFTHIIDTEKVFEDFLNSYEPYVDHGGSNFKTHSHDSDIDPIDDLFDKT